MIRILEVEDLMLTLPPKVEAPRIPSRVAREQDSDRERRSRIAEIAYSLGARRGFDGDSDEAFEDWVTATKKVDQAGSAASR
jgi:hypothetical protein